MLNYTVSTGTLQAAVGDQVDQASPTIELTLTANEGYLLFSGDFSIGDALPPEVASVVFANTSPTTLSCVVTFAPTFVMPAGDVNLPIDIDGVARSIDYNTTGTLIITGDNLNPDSTANGYNFDSAPGEIKTVLFYVKADAGHYFPSPPAVSFSASQNPADYSIFSEIPTLDNEGRATEYFYNVRYIRSVTGDITGDEIKIVGNAASIFTPSSLYYSYVIRDTSATLVVPGTYHIAPGDHQLLLTVYGDVGADVHVSLQKNGGTFDAVASQIITFAGGYTKITVPITGAVATDSYNIILSGDIDPSFAQPNPIQLNTIVNTSVGITATAIPGYTITPIGTTSVSGAQGFVLDGDKINSIIDGGFKITKDDGAIVTLDPLPTWLGNVSGLDYASNGGTDILFGKDMQVIGNKSTEVTVLFRASVTEFGSTPVNAVLSLATDINAAPVSGNIAASVADGESVTISTTPHISDADGNPLTISIVTPPVHGTAYISGQNIIYTHTADNTSPDSFTYIASDGYSSSVPGSVVVTISGEDPNTLTPTGVAGYYRTIVDMGIDAATIEIEFDAGTKPARVELLWNNAVVADSLFVGDNLTDANRLAEIAAIEDTHTQYQFSYVGSGGNGWLYGTTDAWNSYKPQATKTFTSLNIAPTGSVRTVQSNYGGQMRIKPDNNDSADGNLTLRFEKPTSTVNTVVVYVTGIVGSSWNINSITVTPNTP